MSLYPGALDCPLRQRAQRRVPGLAFAFASDWLKVSDDGVDRGARECADTDEGG